MKSGERLKLKLIHDFKFVDIVLELLEVEIES
jgi:hypothetical protein